MAKKRVSLKDRENMESPIKNTLKGFMSTETVKEHVTKSVTTHVTKSEEKTNNKPDIVIPHDLTSKVNKVTKDGVTLVEETRKLKLGNTSFKFVFNKDDDPKRAAYSLHQDTIDKIDICSKATGIKKADLVDHILNSVLSDIINKSK